MPQILEMDLNPPNWSIHGITFVGELCYINGNFINQTELEQKYSLLKANF